MLKALIFSLLLVPSLGLATQSGVTRHVVETSHGPLQFNAYEENVPNYGRQVRYEIEEPHKWLANTTVDVLYGRDLDGDGILETWFLPTGLSVSGPIEKIATAPDGWDVAVEILVNELNIKVRPVKSIVIDALPSLSIVASQTMNGQKHRLIDDELDAYSFQKRIEWAKASGDLTPLELIVYYQALNDQWTAIERSISAHGFRDIYIALGIDAVSFFAAEAAIRVFSTAGEFLVSKFGPAVAKNSNRVLSALERSRMGRGVANVLKRFQTQIGMARGKTAQNLIDAKGAARAGAQTALARVAGETLKEHMARLSVGLIIKQTARKAFLVAREQALYIGMNFSLQSTIEIYNRGLFDKNPWKFANNVMNDKAMGLNLSFMLAETTLQSGVSAAIPNMRRSMIVCGFLSLADSLFWQKKIMNQTDLARLDIDTTWEVTYGNLQTNLDTQMRRRFKVAGWVFAFVDQAIGYWSYNKLTSWYDAKKLRHDNPHAMQTETADSPKLVMIPVLIPN